MIEKDINKLNLSISNDCKLIHMTGKIESKEQCIKNIINVTLNYYDYEILDFSESEALINLFAKVYNGTKSW